MSIVSKTHLRMASILNETIPFLVAHKLWKGFFNQKAVLYLTILFGIAVPITLFNSFDKALDSKNNSTYEMGISSYQLNDLLSSFSGYHKYIIMILFSMLITFVMHKTIDSLTGYKAEITFADYFRSLFRNILLSIRSFVLELVLGILVSIVIGIFGPAWMEEFVKFFIGAFFIGYVFFDSYFYLYKLKIKEASKKIHMHIPAAVILGTVIKLIFAIPFLGAIFGSIIGAVAATWYLHTSEESMAKLVSA